MKNKIKIIQDYINHFDNAPDDCDCAICLSQQQGTYIEGLRQALEIMTIKKSS